MYMPKKKNKFIDNLVSIIMPAFNSAGYICESIDSVLAQTYAEWELWVVDDGSTDNTAEVVKKFKDRRIHYVKQATNKGVAAARNLGIARSRGRFLAFLDSDDLWNPKKLSIQISFMEQNDAHFCCTGCCVIDENGNAVITNCDATDRAIQWNAKSPRFATYTSAQTAIDLYELAA